MLKASLKFRTDSRFGDMPTSRTEYICGLNTRREHRDCNGRSDVVPPTNVQFEYGPQHTYIQNCDLQYGFEIDMDAGVYTAWPANAYGGPAWIKPRLTTLRERSGSTVHNHTETVDTGERKTAFGYTARRVIAKNTSRRGSELTSESESDGWYIDAPVAWLSLHPPPKQGVFHFLHAHVVGGRGNKRDAFKFTQDGERETGFPVLVASTNRSYSRDQYGVMRCHESSHRDEVTEFSEAPLDAALFIPPRDFERVTQLPGGIRHPLSNRLRFRWEMLKDSCHLRKKLALLRPELE